MTVGIYVLSGAACCAAPVHHLSGYLFTMEFELAGVGAGVLFDQAMAVSIVSTAKNNVVRNA